ncbi:Retrovirus-related Pol polyprotein from transposon RE2 [Vitis vinifera]|uniref:Retrovirus-related Pol polyprotein from transposon RE2 n=1 Tax=Vitis vinifera TaxID=29760 RepID=A0A438HCL1_VITVI|nr:Retrovirus-related Pol polyprotein from transposon RE2 [Vitis vinifera]
MATKNPIFTSVISGSPTITSEKLIGSENYLSWSTFVELWFMGQGYEDHLVTPEDVIPDVDKVQWKKIDAQLCSVLWQSVDPKILHHLRAYKTCFKFWTQAKGLYTNDIQRFCKVVSDIVHVRQQDMDLSAYIGWIASLKEEFLTLMPFINDLESIRDQILASSSIPSLDDVFAHLLRLSSTQILVEDNVLNAPIVISLVTLEIVAISYMDDLLALPILLNHLILCYLDLTPLRASHLKSPFLGPWILDSGASDHISSNKHLFSSITTTSALPIVVLANGSQTMAKGIGLAHPLPFLPLHSVLYAPECPFNLISISKITRTLNCSITFSDKFMILQDRSTGKTIGIGRESQGLYHFTSPSSPAACISTDAHLLIHNRLGHLSLSKFQKMVPRFSTLSSLVCESCQLRKHILVSFPKRLNNRAKSPFELVHTNVYHRQHCVVAPPLSSAEVPDDSPHVPPISPTPALSSIDYLPIALRKGNQSTRNPHPIYNFLSYHQLSSSYSAFVSTLSSISLPKSTSVALSHPGWRQAMVDEMATLHSNGTWDLISLPPGYTHIYGCDYGDTFSPVAKIASVRLFLSMAAMCHWPLYQLDIKNAFLHGELLEEVYMEQPPGFVAQREFGLVCKLRRSLYGLKQSPRAWFGCFSSVVQEFGMLRSEANHSVFYHHNSPSQCIYLVVYMDDIVITGSDQEGIQRLKQHLFNHFQTKDLSKLKYFLGLEIAQSSSGVVMSQRKYALDILEEIGKLNYLTITRPDISFPVSVVSQFLQLPCDNHWDVVIRILRYIKGTSGQGMLYEDKGHTQIVGYTDADWASSPSDRCSTSGYCVFIGGNLISWKSKKQIVVARSSAKVEYRAMALAICELIWLRQLLQELRFGKDEHIKLVCDNQAVLHIASNLVFHERTKHIEVDCHFIREKIASGCVATSFVNSNDQLADIFTKSLRDPRIKYICNKLGAYDIYAPV